MKKKFIMVNTFGYSMRNNLNKEGRDGWHFVKMEPFFQQQRMTASHGISKFLVCLEEKKDIVSFYRIKFIKGNSESDFSFRVDDLNEYNEYMEQCGFEFEEYHHVIVLHLHPKYNTRRSMKGYLCLWKISLEKTLAEKMFERMQEVIKIMEKELDREKLCNAPKPAKFAEIKDELEKCRIKNGNIPLLNKDFEMPCPILQEKEKNLLKQMAGYQYLYKTVKKVIELDNLELKKQMGHDWDEGLLEVEPDIEAVINSLSYDFDINTFVEEVLWSSQGNLILSSLSDLIAL